MIYQGTSANATGTETQIGTSAFNSSYNNNAYIGYMYGNVNANDYAGTHANINSSVIKGELDSWYMKNLEIYSAQYIDGSAGFCGDRSITSGSGIGTDATYYQVYIRITNNNSSLQCNDKDVYTTSESDNGNKSLIYPIGLITADEVLMSGGSTGTENRTFYLYTGQSYWTMSPFLFDSGGPAQVFIVYLNGNLNSHVNVNYPNGVRPVINLRADVPLTGTGTADDPFKVVGAS